MLVKRSPTWVHEWQTVHHTSLLLGATRVGGGWYWGGTGVVSTVAVYKCWQTPWDVSSRPSCVQHEGRLETLRGVRRLRPAMGFSKLHITSHLHSLRLYSWNVIMKPLCIFCKRRQGTLYISIYYGQQFWMGEGRVCRSCRKIYNNTCLSTCMHMSMLFKLLKISFHITFY